MWLVKAFFFLLLLFVIVFFSVQNASDMVMLRFFGYESAEMPLIEALLFAFLAGLSVAGLFALWKYFSLLKKYKAALEENNKLVDEIGALRKISFDDSEQGDSEELSRGK
ncbi:MAG TPA: LapA family protein [Firmicutes bacterium]|jgi:uncharacterized integral membrane protein|nr:LapA family protein [Bacillota bacterium]